MSLRLNNQNLLTKFSAPVSRNVCKHQKRNGLQTSCNDPYCNRGVIPKINRTFQKISPTKIRMIIDIELDE